MAIQKYNDWELDTNWKCPHCGKVNKEMSNYCPYCGVQLIGEREEAGDDN